jgi:hypothetical protein
MNIEANTAHGSDAPETGGFEIPCFYSALELVRFQAVLSGDTKTLSPFVGGFFIVVAVIQ